MGIEENRLLAGGLQMHLRAIVGKTISMETRVRDTCCTPFLRHFFFFFPFCFVAIAIEIFFWRPTYGIPAVKIQQTKLTFRPIIVFLITFVQIRI